MKARHRRGPRPTVCPECGTPHDQRSEAEAEGDGAPLVAEEVPPGGGAGVVRADWVEQGVRGG